MTAPTSPRSAGGYELVLERVFAAPRALVFKAWTEREHLMRWSAPHGFTITRCEGDLRPGGRWRACMRAPDGTEHWLGGVYREIVEPERLVFTHAWESAEGQPGQTTLVTVLLEDRQGKTLMKFRQGLFDTSTLRDSHGGGWSECFDRLAEHLGLSRAQR